MTLPELVVLDLAGTTVEDRGEVPAAFVAALAAHGIRVSDAEVQTLRGSSKRAAIAALVPEAPDHAQRTESAYASFQQELHARYAATGVRSVPGTAETLAWLRARGVRIALNTGFDRDTTQRLLAHLDGLAAAADAVICGDDVPRGRPAPDLILRAMAITGTARPDGVANVGDTTLDLEAGRRAGVRWNVGVLSGAHGREALAAAPHTHLVESIALLPRIFGDER
jgi:phosphonatase-like hydrolase